MKTFIKCCLVLSVFVFLASCKDDDKSTSTGTDTTDSTQVVAFPGVEGCGMYVTGGRDGYVYVVNNLEDNVLKSGSLRYALSKPGKKIIIFKVAGVIELKSDLTIGSNVTIYGQSAPGDGICIKNYPVVVEGDNVVIQFLRFRMGDEQGAIGDAFTCIGRSDILVDHCSFSWSTDECVSCYNNENFTLQYCIISESLTNSIHEKGDHGYGGIWGGTNATFHHNLLAHHSSRNPRFCGDRFTGIVDHERVDFQSNVVYNWGYRAGYAGEGGYYNMINNYYKQGPASSSSYFFLPDSDPSNGGSASPLSTVLGGVDQPLWGKFYVSGNTFVDQNGVITQNYDWSGMYPKISESRDGMVANDSTREVIKSRIKLGSEVSMFVSLNKVAASIAYDNVLTYAGASFVRDEVDSRIIDNVIKGSYTQKDLEVTTSSGDHSTNGLIDSQDEVGGWPEYTYSSVLTDSDNDGMPDEWEDENGLNKSSSLDATTYTLDENYSNIEVYMNSIVKHLYP